MRLLRLATACALGCLAPLAALAQFNNGASSADIANLREDITGLDQRIAELSMRIEQLENRASRADSGPRAAAAPMNAVTQQQLAEAVATLSTQIAELRTAVGKLVTVPAESVPAPAPAPRAQGGETASFSHDGTIYTVQKGDTLALIAKKTGGRFQDIVNANRLADPSHIVIGQKLFIPGGK